MIDGNGWNGSEPCLSCDRAARMSNPGIGQLGQRMTFRECLVLFAHWHSTDAPEFIREFMSSRSVIPIKIMTHLLSYTISAGSANTTQLFIEKPLDENFPCENSAFEIKDSSTVTGYFRYHYP
jgi:hypothetical protein